MLVHVKIPSTTQHAFAVEIFCNPKVNDCEDNDEFVDDKSADQGGEHAFDDKGCDYQTLKEEMEYECNESVVKGVGIFLLIDFVPFLDLFFLFRTFGCVFIGLFHFSYF